MPFQQSNHPAGSSLYFSRPNSLIRFSSWLMVSVVIAAARQANAETETNLARRVDLIEGKLDKVLELLEKQAGGDVSATAVNTQPPASENSLQGGLKLRLYMVEGFDLKSIPVTNKKSVAAADVAVPSTYDWGAFTEIGPMKRYLAETSSEDNRYQAALQWSGVLNVPKAGETQFIVSLNVDKKSGSEACVGVLQIDGEDVVRLESEKSNGGYGDSDPRYGSEFGNVGLEQGPHDFSFWVFCTGAQRFNHPNHQAVHFTVDMAGPGQDNPSPITASNLSMPD